jgi:hypothetical protein
LDGKLKSKREVSRTISIIGQTMFIYGFLAWIYGTIISILDVILCTNVVTFPVSHLFPWMSIGEMTVFAFFLSMIGFFVWRTKMDNG